MKRWLPPLVIVGLLALIGSILWRRGDPRAPRYQTLNAGWTPPPYDVLHYDFLTHRPFAGDKVWLTTTGSNQVAHAYLLDLRQKQVLGELINAHPVFMDESHTKVLCMQRRALANDIRVRVQNWLAKLSQGRLPFSQQTDLFVETFWLVNLGGQPGRRMGKILLDSGDFSRFQPSPNFRLGANMATLSFSKAEILFFNLETEAFINLTQDGWPVEWWDESRLVVKTTGNDFITRDSITGTSNLLVSASQIAAFFEINGLPNPAYVNLFPVWNGDQFEFYFVDSNPRGQGNESYLIKVTRPDAGLELVDKNFKVEWLGRFDPTRRWYAYTALNSGAGSDAVFLRDLRDNSERVLVPPLGARTFSLPNHYRSNVIFVRSNRLFQISLDGRQVEQLFPPDATRQ